MHKVRIVNPSRDDGSTLGTEVWLDDFKLDAVTHVEFEAAMQSVYRCNVSLNVRVLEIEGRMRVNIEAVDYDAVMQLVDERAAARAATNGEATELSEGT